MRSPTLSTHKHPIVSAAPIAITPIFSSMASFKVFGIDQEERQSLTYVFDHILRNLRLQRAIRSMSYGELACRIKGVVRKISFGNRAVVTEHQARGAAQLLILEAKVRRDPLARKRDALAAPMCTAFADLYRRVGVLRWKPGTIKAYDSYWRTHLGPTFGRRFLDQIDEASVFEWFSGLSRKRPGAANRALDILRSMFATAE